MSKTTISKTQCIKVYFAEEPYKLLEETINVSGDSISRIIGTLICEHLPENYLDNKEEE